MERESFVFYNTWKEIYFSLSKKLRPIFIEYILKYELEGVPIPVQNRHLNCIIMGIKPAIEIALKKANAGAKGGSVTGSSKARNGNENASKTQTERNLYKEEIYNNKGLLYKDEKEVEVEKGNQPSPPPTLPSQDIAKSHELVDVDSAIAVLQNSEIFLENTAIQFSIEKEFIRQKLIEFAIYCKAIGKDVRSVSEIRKHFNNWLRKKIEKENEVKGDKFNIINELMS